MCNAFCINYYYWVITTLKKLINKKTLKILYTFYCQCDYNKIESKNLKFLQKRPLKLCKILIWN